MKLKHLLLTIPLVLGMGLLNIAKVKEPISRIGKSRAEIKVMNTSGITFSDKAISNLYHIYKGVKNEVPFCLYGFANENRIHVRDVEMPLITYNSKGKVSFNSRYCNFPDYIGIAHNHKRSCLPSLVDLYRFRTDQRASVELIICGVSKENIQMDMSAFFIDRKHR